MKEDAVIDLDKMRFPTFNVHQMSNLSATPANFFGLALGLFMISAPLMGWIDYQSPSLGVALVFGGLCEYIMGIFDWYQGRGILCFVDFIFGLLHLTIYFTADLGKYQIYVPENYRTYMQGTFCAIWLVIMICLIFASKDKGAIYIIDFFLLSAATLFLLIWEFRKSDTYRKIGGYFLFIGAVFIWISGLGKLLNSVFQSDMIPLTSPSL